MKLFIFRCPARRRLYGATTYETGSNLPKDKCTGGWEFYEQVELRSRGSEPFRFAVDLDRLRRQVAKYGWCVWDESPKDPLAATLDRKPLAREEHLPPAKYESISTRVVLPAIPSPPHPKAVPQAEAPARQVSVPPTPETHISPRATTVPPPRHQVVWFEMPVRDLDRAIRFYSAVLGLQLKKQQAGFGVAMAVLPYTEGSIGGCLVQNADARPSENGPLLYLNAKDRLDEALHAVERCGGKVIMAKHSIAPFGFRAIVLDSEGNRIALHSN